MEDVDRFVHITQAMVAHITQFHAGWETLPQRFADGAGEQNLSTVSRAQNAGDADVWGVEAEFVGEIVEGLTVDAALSWLDFEYTRLDPLTGLPPSSTQVYTPEWKASVGVQYVFDLAETGTLTPRLDAAFQANEIRVDLASYTSDVILRYDTGLGAPLSELAILLVARRWSARRARARRRWPSC